MNLILPGSQAINNHSSFICYYFSSPWNCSIHREIAQEVNTSRIHAAAVQLFSISQYIMIYLVFLQDYKESPVGSHGPPVSVSSCPLLRLHTISQSLTAGVKAPETNSVFTLQLS